ncbi:uncharacterized protein BXZ73DRAFT_98003 [Epithele typhae]|uniref:uncharacterized protein n=1 Tax=Epithele typhae TaxID=378194 RepID=UPI002008B7FF|nr:uncharacterized protein BXZ73DRAFT_98003 [Epithele typhae]KAH9941613.1 hypothetical protein BXZ73DRAFT_98003 [Epithele typhae]
MASIRAFAVFCDEPESLSADVEGNSPPTTTISIPPPSGPLLVYQPDKENMDPSTGSRVLPDHDSCKKRKTALSVKTQPVSPSKKPRPLAEKPLKKAASKIRSAEKKPKRSSSTTKRNAHPVDQVVIDAKCKELTVLPLADISEAYEQVASQEDAVGDAEKAAEKAVTAVLPDKTERASTPPPSSQADATPSPVNDTRVLGSFSTPERKRIYSAFTFSSPSAASERYATSRASTVERFSDVAL